MIMMEAITMIVIQVKKIVMKMMMVKIKINLIAKVAVSGMRTKVLIMIVL